MFLYSDSASKQGHSFPPPLGELEGVLHARLDGGGAEDGSEYGDDELNDVLPGFFFHSFKF